MRYTLALFAGTLLLAGSVALAESSPKEERIGLGLGATVGAVAGGPVGGIIGAAIGAKFGDNYHKKNAQIESLTLALDEQSRQTDDLEKTVAALNRQLADMDTELRRVQTQSRPELVALLAEGIETDLLFRTDEHVLNDNTHKRIAQLAETLSSMPEVLIQLDGFADERGAADYNQRLSARRAEHIREVLVSHGVEGDRIGVTAHGESAADDTQPDSLALQRRVSLRLFIDGAPSVAANPQ